MKETYQITTGRVWKHLLPSLLHLAISVLLGAGGYYFNNHSWIGFYVVGAIYLVQNVPTILLFYSSWREDAQKSVTIDTRQGVIHVVNADREKHISFTDVKRVILHKTPWRQTSTANEFYYFQLDLPGGKYLMLTAFLIEEGQLPFAIDFVQQEVNWEVKPFDYPAYQHAVQRTQLQQYEAEIEQFKQKFRPYSLQELIAITSDKKYVRAAVEAARTLIKEKEN